MGLGYNQFLTNRGNPALHQHGIMVAVSVRTVVRVLQDLCPHRENVGCDEYVIDMEPEVYIHVHERRRGGLEGIHVPVHQTVSLVYGFGTVSFEVQIKWVEI